MEEKNAAEMLKQRGATAQTLKQKAKTKKKKERFLRTRMWVSTIISSIFNDRGTIPPNIGNNILVTNNLYVTKNALSAVIMVGEFSDDTVVGFCSDLINTVKSQVSDVIVDITIKNQPYWIDTKQSGMASRVHTWENIMNSPLTNEKSARRAARQLYTLQVAESGEPMYRSRVYVTVRAKEGRALNRGVKAVSDYLNTCAIYRNIKNNLKEHLDFMCMMSDKGSKFMKNVSWMVTSQQVLAEMFPQTQGPVSYTHLTLPTNSRV